MVGPAILASQPASLRITFGCWRWTCSHIPTHRYNSPNSLNKALRTFWCCLFCLASCCFPLHLSLFLPSRSFRRSFFSHDAIFAAIKALNVGARGRRRRRRPIYFDGMRVCVEEAQGATASALVLCSCISRVVECLQALSWW